MRLPNISGIMPGLSRLHRWMHPGSQSRWWSSMAVAVPQPLRRLHGPRWMPGSTRNWNGSCNHEALATVLGRRTAPGSGPADAVVDDHRFRADRALQRLRTGYGHGQPAGGASWYRPGHHAGHQPGPATGAEVVDTVVICPWHRHAARNTGAGCRSQYTALAGFWRAALSTFRTDETGGADDGRLVFALKGVAAFAGKQPP